MKIPITQTVTYSKDRGQNCAQKELKCISQIKQATNLSSYKNTYDSGGNLL